MALLAIYFSGISSVLLNVHGQSLNMNKEDKHPFCTEPKNNHLAEVEGYLKTSVALKLLQLENQLQSLIDGTMNSPQNLSERAPNSTRECQDLWTKFRDSCYFYSKGIQLRWLDAMSFCQNIGGNLAVPEDYDENEYLKQIARDSGEIGVWIGISDAYIRGQWLSYPDMTPINITDWALNEPNNDLENCIEIYRAHGYSWNDQSCLDVLPFICEKPA